MIPPLPNPLDILEQAHYNPKLLLFASFDLVGSSQFKSQASETWPNTFMAFFERTYNEVTNFMLGSIGFETWKLQGDEILFFLCVSSKAMLKKAVSHIYQVQKNLAEELPDPLSIKTSMWLAFINGEFNKELPLDFLGTFRGDFIGATIDEGFRITTQFCRPQRVTLGFDLAYVLLRNNVPSIYCVGYQKLKGIWNNRRYPVFWYSEDYEEDRENTAYDAEYECELTRTYIHDCPQIKKDRLEKIMHSIQSVDPIRYQHFNAIKSYLGLGSET